jgi:hypothetical protein
MQRTEYGEREKERKSGIQFRIGDGYLGLKSDHVKRIEMDNE